MRGRTRGIDVIVPRHRLDISLADLGYALLAALFARDAERRARRVAHSWAAADEAMACASVRCRRLPALGARPARRGRGARVGDHAPGRSAHHRLPRPRRRARRRRRRNDGAAARRARGRPDPRPGSSWWPTSSVDGSTLQISPSSCAARAAPRRGLRANPSSARRIRAIPAPTVSLYSFGSIKTATALRGALVRVRERELLERMRVIEGAWPRQPRREHAAKSLKYMALIVLDRPLTFTLLVRLTRLVGLDVDRFVSQTVRAFKARPGENADDRFSRWLRRRPSTPLLALLRRRLGRFDAARLDARRRAGALVAAALPPDLERPGRGLPDSTHWVFPVVSQDPGYSFTRSRAQVST